MKALALLFMAFALQQAAAQSIEAARHSRPLAMGSLPPTEITDDVQRLFIKQQWVPGTVLLKNNNTTLHFPLLFDVYSNQLYYQKAGLVMEFLEPVEEFTLRIMRKNDSVDLLYRRGYPVFQKNNDATYYEVLVDGAYQLLRCKAKSIYLVKEEVPEEERTYQKELLFAYLPGGKLVLLKKDKDHVLAQMPEAAPAIERIAAQHKLKLKNEEQLVRLFTLLNKAG
jgi:hypothetical protein